MTPKREPELKEPDPEGPALRKPNIFRNPALMILIVLGPLFVAMYLSFTRPPPPDNAAPVAPKAAVAEAGPPVYRTLREDENMADIMGMKGMDVPEGGRGSADKRTVSCGFTYLIGMKPDQDVFTKITMTGKAYRVLPPGSAMTMDHSHTRVNLELDDQGIIQKVWCG